MTSPGQWLIRPRKWRCPGAGADQRGRGGARCGRRSRCRHGRLRPIAAHLAVELRLRQGNMCSPTGGPRAMLNPRGPPGVEVQIGPQAVPLGRATRRVGSVIAARLPQSCYPVRTPGDSGTPPMLPNQAVLDQARPEALRAALTRRPRFSRRRNQQATPELSTQQ
jgi:hypothetical protein